MLRDGRGGESRRLGVREFKTGSSSNDVCELAETIFIHPALNECLLEAAVKAGGKVKRHRNPEITESGLYRCIKYTYLSRMPFTYEYPRAALTVDCVVFGFDEGALKVLLIRRGIEPYQDHWALPGGFVKPDETLAAAALRELQEETGLREVYLEQLYTFGEIERDPRERVISIAYFALVRRADHLPAAATDAAEAEWFEAEQVPALAFDHAKILKMALERLRGKIRWQPVGFELLPRKFTLTRFQALYEAILGRDLDKRNFRKKLLALDLLVALEEFTTAGSRRPAQLYRFDQRKYQTLTRKGFIFDL